MDTCKVVGALAVMTMIAGAILAICLVRKDRRRRRRQVKPVVSPEDLERYQGKHVMTHRYGGPVLAAGDSFEEMMAEAAALDTEVQQRLVYVYLPRKEEVLIGGQFVRRNE